MPIYKNNSTVIVALGSTRIEPGQAATIMTYYTDLPTGVDKLNDVGFYDPVVQSGTISSTTTVTIDASLKDNQAYEISLFVVSGAVNVKINGSAVGLLMGAGQSEKFYCTTRIINTLTFTISSGVINYSVVKK